MMEKRGMITWYGVSLAILISGIVLLVILVFFPHPPSGRGRELRVRLLYKTDHQALLDACRELSHGVRSSSLKPGMYPIRSNPNQEIVQFPQVVLGLMPAYVDLHRDGMVIVAMMGGVSHFGVVFYPDDYEMSSPQARPLGHKQIIDGLWYYDDGYDEVSDWQQRIDALRPKEKRG